MTVGDGEAELAAIAREFLDLLAEESAAENHFGGCRQRG